MTSIIKNAASSSLTYSTSASSLWSSSDKPDNVFTDSDNPYFASANGAPNPWWQISFSREVQISSYLIKTSSSYPRRPTSWHVDVSNDGSSWKTVHSVAGRDIGGNTAKFYPNDIIRCIHLRIILDQNSSNDNCFLFTFFDCFGELYITPTQTNKVKSYCNTGCKQSVISFQTFILTLINFMT
jgi:hypothetical protein